jgi:hypothetical protein
VKGRCQLSFCHWFWVIELLHRAFGNEPAGLTICVRMHSTGNNFELGYDSSVFRAYVRPWAVSGQDKDGVVSKVVVFDACWLNVLI